MENKSKFKGLVEKLTLSVVAAGSLISGGCQSSDSSQTGNRNLLLFPYNPSGNSGEVYSSRGSDAITDITYRTNIREEDLQDVVLKVNGIEVPAYPRIYEDMFGGSAKNLLDTGVLFVPDLFKNGENSLGVTAFDKKGRTSAYSANIKFDNEVQLDGYQPEENKGLPTFKVESFKVNVKVEKKPLHY